MTDSFTDDVIQVARALITDMDHVAAESAAHRLLRDLGPGCGSHCTICSQPPRIDLLLWPPITTHP